MIAQPNFNLISPQEYLEWEATQEVRYEYVYGKLYAMTGGTKPHNRIALNLFSALDSHLEEKGCEIYISDVKVQVSASGIYYYPDVVVTCDSRDRDSNKFVQYPCLIVEVLSPCTEMRDRGTKFARYRKLETLQEYLLIQSEEIGVECFRRNEQGLWVLYPSESGDTLALESVGFSLPLEALYRQVRFESTQTEPS